MPFYSFWILVAAVYFSQQAVEVLQPTLPPTNEFVSQQMLLLVSLHIWQTQRYKSSDRYILWNAYYHDHCNTLPFLTCSWL